MVLHSYPTPFAILPKGMTISPIYKTGSVPWEMHVRRLTRTYHVHSLDNNPKYVGLQPSAHPILTNGVIWPMAIFDPPIVKHDERVPYTILGFVFDPSYLTNKSVLTS